MFDSIVIQFLGIVLVWFSGMIFGLLISNFQEMTSKTLHYDKKWLEEL